MKSMIVAMTAMVLTLTSCNWGSKTPPPPGQNPPAPAPGQVNPPQVRVEWEKVTKQAPPKERLSIWISADSIKGAKDGSKVSQWNDKSDNKLNLKVAAGKSEPKYVAKGTGGASVVRFNGDSHLETELFKGGTILNESQATVFAVYSQADSGKIAELFGWGDCVKTRFLLHTTGGGNYNFHMGDPELFSVNANAPVAENTLHIVTLFRDNANGLIEVNGLPVGNLTNGKSMLSNGIENKFQVGNSACGHGFKGDLAELIIYGTALNENSRQGITKHLAEKYKIELK